MSTALTIANVAAGLACEIRGAVAYRMMFDRAVATIRRWRGLPQGAPWTPQLGWRLTRDVVVVYLAVEAIMLVPLAISPTSRMNAATDFFGLQLMKIVGLVALVHWAFTRIRKTLAGCRYIQKVATQLRAKHQTYPERFAPEIRQEHFHSLERMQAQGLTPDVAADLTAKALTVATENVTRHLVTNIGVTEKSAARHLAPLFQAALVDAEKTANADKERLTFAVEAMRAHHLVWKIGLTEEEREKPEAAAVLQGMFDSIAQYSGLDHDHGLAAFCVALGDPDQPVTPNLTTGTLLKRMLGASSDPKLLPWVCYAGNKIRTVLRSGLDPTDVTLELTDAVKAGSFFDPAATATAARAITLLASSAVTSAAEATAIASFK